MVGGMAAARRWRKTNGAGDSEIARTSRPGLIFTRLTKNRMRQTMLDDMKPIPIHLFRGTLAMLAIVSAAGAAASPTMQGAADPDAVPLIVIDAIPLHDAIH